MNIKEIALNDLKYHWNQYNLDEFLLTNNGSSGAQVFIGKDYVFKFYPENINVWQKLSFINEVNILNELDGNIFNVKIPKIIKPKQNYSNGFVQTKVNGISLSEMLKENNHKALNIINSEKFINSIANFIVEFNSKLSDKKLVPIKPKQSIKIDNNNLKILQKLCPNTLIILNEVIKNNELNTNNLLWIHNDFNYENIFIDEKDNFSIIDFGESTQDNSLLSLGKLFYSMNLGNSLGSAWKIVEKINELDKNFPSPELVIFNAIIPAVNSLQFKLLMPNPNIKKLTDDIENYSILLFNELNKKKISEKFYNLRNIHGDIDFKNKFLI